MTAPAPIVFALPKGRILDEALPLLADAGVVPEADFFDKASRKLSFATSRAQRALRDEVLLRLGVGAEVRLEGLDDDDAHA